MNLIKYEEARKEYRNYVVCFSDGRIKIGMTSNLKRRMRHYVGEAKRSGAQQVTWWASTSFAEKHSALLMERLMCNSYKHMAIYGFREWIEGDSKIYAGIIKQAEFVRDLPAGGKTEKKESLGWWTKSGSLGVTA
jgi:predicted GIY-YIG superfamily endonuclease